MRKVQQKPILELLQTLREATVEIRSLFSSAEKDNQAILNLMADCQTGAVQVGEFIESIEGEGTQTVVLLEEYHETLYSLSTQLDLLTSGQIKKLDKHLILIENSVKNELKPNRIEIIFLPYQSSMWDSLESIYLAAKNDPSCDVFVIPIPSYELNQNGTLGLMRYDGDKYDKNIEITNWQEYSIEARHPDIIYTHYPYDDNVSNYSIHPMFYSKTLREYCDLLVHVPYYVQIGDVIHDYNAYLPGVLYADKVILQSEPVRQSYIKHYNEACKKFDIVGHFGKAEEKFIALGSPKYDKIINSKYDDFKLPEKWKKSIEKPDGTRKKVILLNTHMWRWLTLGEKYFEKLFSVFEEFENNDNVVLWWRPHPNTEANFRVKRPQLLDKYFLLIEEYKNKGWGIYDDTPDLHRALVCTDVYYGDHSSLVTMYLATGKPVMISNAFITQKEKQITLTHIFKQEEKLYFFDSYYNSLFRIDKNKWEPEYLGNFPDERDITRQAGQILYLEPDEVDENIYFPAYIATNIVSYSIKDDIFSKIPFDKHDKDFVKAIAYENNIFFTPSIYPGILQLDCKSNKLTVHSNWIASVKKLTNNNPDGLIATRSIAVKNCIWFSFVSANAVLCFNMDTYESTVYEVGKPESSYGNICFDGINFWIVPYPNKDTPLIKWHPETGIVKEFEAVYADEAMSQSGYIYIECYKDYIWLFSSSEKPAIKINVKTDEITVADEFTLINSDGTAKPYEGFLCPKVIDDSIYVISTQTRTLIEYNFATKRRREKVLCFPPEIEEKIEPLVAELFYSDIDLMKTEIECCYRESGIVHLNDYIKYIQSSNKDREKEDEALKSARKNSVLSVNENTDGTAGQAIYEYSKETLEK